MYILDNPNSVVIGTAVTFKVIASRGGPLSVFSTTPDICQVSTDSGTGTSTAQAIAVGTCIVICTQEADSSFRLLAQEQIIKNFEVVKIPQKITLNSPGSIILNNGNSVNFLIDTKEDYSNTVVTLISDTPLVCDIFPGTLAGTAITTGTCRLTATVATTAVYGVAVPVSIAFEIQGAEVGENIITVVVPQNQIVSGTITNNYK